MFTQVLRSEWTKLRSVRSTWWLVALAVVLTAGVGVAISAAAAAEPSSSALPAACGPAASSAIVTALTATSSGKFDGSSCSRSITTGRGKRAR